MTIKHPLIDLLEKNTIETAYENVNNIKVNRTIHPTSSLTLNNLAAIEKVIETYELAVVDYWKYAFDGNSKNYEKKQIFHQICKECFSLMEVYPIPKNPIQKIIHILKLIAYAYLGEKWEDMKRYLKEHDEVWQIELLKDSTWDYRLFVNIYKAILHLTRKESWEDLSDSIKIILKLREEQKKFEKEYLNKIKDEYKRSSVLQLASFYHLAKAVEIVGEYMAQGTPRDAETRIDFHFEKAIAYSQNARMVELDIILRILNSTFKKMIYNSVWVVAKRINSRVTEFTELITKSNKPVFEFLYPQRLAILEKGLLDPASRAIVVNLPTSSGKTIMAEFRILQAINTFGKEGKIVYVVPTRALVNQIAARLRNDLGPLKVKIEKMSGAVEIDSFEENLISKKSFNVLVTTPEKLQLLIRHPEKNLAKSLVLAIIDEAHNLSHDSRGMNLEMLLSTIKNDCEQSHLLLLTPFIPNSQDIAKWLDPQNPKSISMELDWKPNDKVVGLYYAQGNRRKIKTFFQTLVTSQHTIKLNDKILIGETSQFSHPISAVKDTNYRITSLISTQFDPSQNFLVLGRNPDEAWKIADLIYQHLPEESKLDDNIILVKKFIESELGSDFPLVKYLEKRIGIHHSGLPDEVRELMEWLMENGNLRILVATTTIAQGVNFPVSGILLSSYSYPYKNMPSRDFWNLLGRAGRIDQHSLGIIGLAVNNEKTDKVIKTARYVKNVAEDLVSVLVTMVDNALSFSKKLDLSSLAYTPEWSSFVQYIAHMKNQSQNLDQFIAEAEITLKRTYGYNQLQPEKQKSLLNAVKEYGEKLDGKPYISTLSDLTGFTPETIESTMQNVQSMNIKQEDWDAKNLFSPATGKLSALVGVMLNNIPEVKRDLAASVSGQTITEKTISSVISDWVSGKEITEIAATHFGGTDQNSITNCIKAIHSKITNSATWGLAGIQKIPGSGLEFDNMTEEQKKQVSNLPSMIYYGVDSEEAILMRMYSVPRSISKKIGTLYKNTIDNSDIYSDKAADVLTWLDKLPEGFWKPVEKNISGKEYKKIWRKLSGKKLTETET